MQIRFFPATAKNWLLLVLVCLLPQIAACSDTVTWQEEVLLNTGDTIMVTRTITYSYKSEAGNPFDVRKTPDALQTIEFSWKDTKYRYRDTANVFVIAISPAGFPALVARARDNNWDIENKFRCATPGYVQFVPSDSPFSWNWPTKIEPWLHGLPANLRLDTGEKPSDIKEIYTIEDHKRSKSSEFPSLRKIDVSYRSGPTCEGIK